MAKTPRKLARSQLPMAKLQPSPPSVLLGRPGCLTSQTLLKHGKDCSSRGGEIRPLSGCHHAVRVCFFGCWPARHVDSRETRLSENPEVQSELDPRMLEAKGCSNIVWLLYILTWEKTLKIRDLDKCCPGCGRSPEAYWSAGQ